MEPIEGRNGCRVTQRAQAAFGSCPLFFSDPLPVFLDHHCANLIQGGFRFPPQSRKRFVEIAAKEVDLGRADKFRVDPNKGSSLPPAIANFVLASPLPLKIYTNGFEGQGRKITNSCRSSRRKYVIAASVRLKCAPKEIG